MGTSVAPVAPAVVDAAPASPASTPAAPNTTTIAPQPTRGDVLRSLGTRRPENAPTDTVPAPTNQAEPPAPPEALEADAAPEVEAQPVEKPTEPVSDGLKYKKRNAAGEYIAPDSTAKVEIEIDGKKHLKSEAELVRAYHRSVQASRIQNENRDLRERHIPEITQRYEAQVQQAQTAHQEQAALNLEIMQAAVAAIRHGDTSGLEGAVAQWERLNSTETLLAQTQQELAAERQQRETEQQSQRYATTLKNLHSVVVPTFERLTAEHADAFGGGDAGKNLLLTTLRGRLTEFGNKLSGPLEYRQQLIAQYVQGDLTRWVTEEATRLRGSSATALAAKQQAEQDAQRARQAQRQAEARGLVPVGQTPSSSSPAPRTTPLTKEQVLSNLRSGPR